MRLNEEGESVVVVPSVTIDRVGERSGSLAQAYEERFLFLLLLLRQPRLRMVYVTSMPIAPVDRRVLPGPAAGGHPQPRSCPAVTWCRSSDGSPRPLTAKLLERPACSPGSRSLIPDRRRSHLVPVQHHASWSGTSRSRSGIPMYGADPRLFHLGTKTGCRRLFAEEGVRHPLGFEDLHSLDEVVDAIARDACAASARSRRRW